MFVPIILHTTQTIIENKTIVYSDTVLNVKDLGNNLKVSVISNVSEYSLKNCLNIILESNPNVIFNTIQYSKNNQRIYFYTNQEISTKEWHERQIITYKPITTRIEILEEIKRILNSKINNDSNCISIYDASLLMKSKYNQYHSLTNKYIDFFDHIVKRESEKVCLTFFEGFDCISNELHLSFLIDENWRKISFKKENGDLYVSKSESIYSDEVLHTLESHLSNMYDELIKFNAFNKEHSYFVISYNAKFKVDICASGVKIYNETAEFILSEWSFEEGFRYSCNSNAIIEALKGHENELFKKIYVKIDDCPDWSKPILYETRQQQLEVQGLNKERKLQERKLEEERLLEQQKLEEKIQQKEKRMKLIRKIFPFIKK